MRTIFGSVVAALIAAALIAGGSAAAQGPRGLVINEDNSHFFGTRQADDMTLEGLHAFVDQYAGTEASHLFLCPNAMRASFRSTTRDAIWDPRGQDAPEPGFGGPWAANARLLHERGLDPYAVWIARCREKGLSPWLSMRMNDVHDVDNLKNFMHSTFWVEHPEYWRVPGGAGWTDRALDYAVPEVREHNMAFIRELLERYDPDGLELDWMRFGYHFAPGKEAEGSTLLTQFMRDVRALTREWSEKRGHAIQLGARVPAHPDAASGLGMDGVAWAKEGLIDMLVPTPFWLSSDFDIPVELWRERMGDAAGRVIIAPGLEFILVGGHARGQAILLVNTKRGPIVLASDAVHVYDETDFERPFAIFYDLPGMLEGYRRINRLAGSRDHVIPGHDARVTKAYPAYAKGTEGRILRLDEPPKW